MDFNGRSIQVSGLQIFSQHEWRNALLYYLFGIWAMKQEIVYRPKISFSGPGFSDGVSLCLEAGDGKYSVLAGSQLPRFIPGFNAGEVLCVSSEKTQVEVGLVRFVKDNSIRMLKIDFGEGKVLALWKHRCRGQYSFAGQNLDGYPVI